MCEYPIAGLKMGRINGLGSCRVSIVAKVGLRPLILTPSSGSKPIVKYAPKISVAVGAAAITVTVKVIKCSLVWLIGCVEWG